MTKRKETEDETDVKYEQGQKVYCPRQFDIFVSSVLLRFKPQGNKARLACHCWVESGTIQGRGCPSYVKEGLSPALYIYGSLGL